MNTFDALAEELQKLLKIEEYQAVRLAELLEDHVKALISDGLDREHCRGDYRTTD